MTRAARNLAAVALGFAVLSFALVWLAMDPEVRSYPALAIPAAAMFLLAPPLGILAMILGRQARKRASLAPGPCAEPTRAYFRMSLLSFCVWALVVILMVPLLARTPRGRARDRAALWNLENGLADLADAYGKASSSGFSEAGRLEALERLLAAQQDRKNPWQSSQPGLRVRVLTSAPGETAARALAAQQATTLGQVVFTISAPSTISEPRWLAGAVQTGTPGSSSTASPVAVLATRLEP